MTYNFKGNEIILSDKLVKAYECNVIPITEHVLQYFIDTCGIEEKILDTYSNNQLSKIIEKGIQDELALYRNTPKIVSDIINGVYNV